MIATLGGGGRGQKGRGTPFTGDDLTDVLPRSSRMWASSPICLRRRSELFDQTKSPSPSCSTDTLVCERDPEEEAMSSLRARTALAALAGLKLRARAVQALSLSAQKAVDRER